MLNKHISWYPLFIFPVFWHKLFGFSQPFAMNRLIIFSLYPIHW